MYPWRPEASVLLPSTIVTTGAASFAAAPTVNGSRSRRLDIPRVHDVRCTITSSKLKLKSENVRALTSNFDR
jgi:hypothetical protein